MYLQPLYQLQREDQSPLVEKETREERRAAARDAARDDASHKT